MVTKPAQNQPTFLNPKTQEFAQMKRELAWVKTKTGFVLQASGLGRFLNGITDEMKQRYRERLFAVTDRNLIDVAGRYLGVGQQTCGVAILGPENESIRKDPSWVVK